MGLSEMIRWSKREYGMRELVETFGHSLPVLCKVMAGFDGGDDELNIIGADEVYWIYGIQKQTRLVTRAGNNRYASIPVDYALRMHIVNKHKQPGAAVSVQEVVDQLRFSAVAPEVMLENNKRVAVSLGDDGGTSAQFGVMAILDTYDQKYLLGNPILGHDICPATIGLPVYLEVSFVVAEGFVHTEDDSEYRSWFRDVTQMQETFERKPIETFKEIIVFNKCPANSEYEYIRPTAFDGGLSKDKGGRQSTAENEYVVAGFYCKTTVDSTAGYSQASPVALPVRTGQTKRVGLPGLAPPCKSPDQSARQKRPAPPPVPHQHQSSRQPDGGSLRCRVLPPSAPPVSPSATVTGRTTSTWSPIPPKKKKVPPSVVPPPVGPPGPRPKPPPQLPISSKPPGQGGGGHLPWTSPGEIPKDVDMSSWTKQDVADCLRLLKLDKYVKSFEQQDVDGQLLHCLEENMMTDKDAFGMSAFEAIKLRKFVHDGWRPT